MAVNNLTPQVPPGHPVEWEVPVSIVAMIQAMMPRYGKYAINILADNVHLGSLPFRIVSTQPPGPTLLQILPPGDPSPPAS